MQNLKANEIYLLLARADENDVPYTIDLRWLIPKNDIYIQISSRIDFFLDLYIIDYEFFWEIYLQGRSKIEVDRSRYIR